MGKCRECRLLRPRQQLVEGRCPRQIDAQGERVDEVADHPLELAAVATREGRSDDDVVLTRVALEQRRVGSEEHHEERAAALAGDGLEPLSQVRREHAARVIAHVLSDGRPRPVGRQLEPRGRTAQNVFPVTELLLEDSAVEPRAMPHGVVRVLDPERFELRLAPLESGVVQLGEVAGAELRVTSRRSRCDA